MADAGDRTNSNEIWVNEFTEESAANFREQVLEISKEYPDQPIIVYIDSYGGYVDSLAKMLETMNNVPNKFITACMGKAVSCGAILLSHGDVRYCGTLSRVMVHNVSSGSWGDAYSLKATSDEVMRINKVFMALLAANCGLSYTELQAKIKASTDSREIWMDAQAARDFHIIDEIGAPLVQSCLQWKCMTITGDAPKKRIFEAPQKPAAPKKPVRTKKATKKVTKSKRNK